MINGSSINGAAINAPGNAPELRLRLTIYIWKVGPARLPIQVAVSGKMHLPIQVQITGATSYRMTLPMAVHIAQPEQLYACRLPVAVYLQRLYALHLPVTVKVAAPVTLHLPLHVRVLTPAALSAVTTWSVQLLISGMDMSAALTGEIRIELEENKARLMEISLCDIMAAASWSGADVSLDLIQHGDVVRLFTGRIEMPEVDLVARIVRLSCIDRRRDLLAGATREGLAALIGGHWSPAIFNADANSLQYAEDRLSTVAAALDLNVYGLPRLTAWAPKSVPDYTLTTDDLLDEQLPTVEMTRRSEVFNSLSATFEYRYQRLRTYRHQVDWDMGITLDDFMVYTQPVSGAFATSGATFIAQPKWLVPSRELFISAAQNTGWHLSAALWRAQPESRVFGVPIHWTTTLASFSWVNNYTPVNDPMCWGAKLILNNRVAQEVTESWSVTVTAPDSIDAYGLLAQTETGGSLVAEFDGASWESSLNNGQADIQPFKYVDWGSADPRHAGLGVEVVDQTDIKAAGRGDASEAIQCLAAVLKTKILASHRQTTVTLQTPLMPRFDADQTIRLDCDWLDATGKLSHMVHVLNLDTGSATTEMRISLYADIAVGNVPVTPLPAPATPPAATVPAVTATAIGTLPETVENNTSNDRRLEMESEWRRHGGVVLSLKNKDIPILDDAYRYTNEVVVSTPEIPASERDPLTLPMAYSHTVAIPFNHVIFK